MTNHLTPDELADQLRMDQQEVIGHCVQMGIPIFHGRIDRTLFESSLRSTATAGNATSLRADTPH
jgi:predicted nuclease with TOPRIM domain